MDKFGKSQPAGRREDLRFLTGKGQYVDVALYESVFNIMESLVPEFDVLGFKRERGNPPLLG